MATKSAAQVVNATLLEQLASADMRKQAEDNINSYTRSIMREDGAYRKILPMQELADDELDVQLGTDLPVKIIFKEPLTTGALTIPFAGSPRAFIIRGPNYPVYFTQITGPKHMKHVDELRVYPFDIRQVLTDHSIRDIMEEEDRRWFSDTVDTAMIGADQTSPYTNNVQWRTLRGGWTRENVVEAMKTLPRGDANLKPDKVVINSVTVYDFQKWGRDEMGGDMSQDLLKNGRAEGNWLVSDFMQATWMVTIKKNLVADGTMYMFSTEQYLGKSFSLSDITMFIDRRGPVVEFYPYETIGGALGNLSGVGRADIEGG
jgi:hypothetical protein